MGSFRFCGSFVTSAGNEQSVEGSGMRVGKSLLLGTAAGVIVVSAAQAADLPVKAKPIEYVKVCSLYGAGFFYIPGTDKCIKLGGYFREQWNIHGAGDSTAYMNSSARWTRTDTSDSSFRTRTLFSVDVREQSAYGTIRGYTAFGAQQTTPNDPNSAIFFSRSFVQFAGFTGGRAISFFDLIAFELIRLLYPPRQPGQHQLQWHQRVCLHMATRQRRLVLGVGGKLLRFVSDLKHWQRSAMLGRQCGHRRQLGRERYHLGQRGLQRPRYCCCSASGPGVG